MFDMNLKRYLDEDICDSDTTSEILIDDDFVVIARIVCKERCVLAGLSETVDISNEYNIDVNLFFKDGNDIVSEDIILEMKGSARNILLLERIVLNILGRMSGVATKAREYVDKVNKINEKIKVATTRKTLPGFMHLDKKAGEIGGCYSYRSNLGDAIMIKDNHLVLMNTIEEVLKKVKNSNTDKKVEIEVESSKDAVKAVKIGVDIIMLDNMKPKEVKKTVDLLRDNNLRNKVLIEVSGGINLENIKEYAQCDIDIISIGAITNNAKSIDFSLEILGK